jgi:hypothetical protein
MKKSGRSGNNKNNKKQYKNKCLMPDNEKFESTNREIVEINDDDDMYVKKSPYDEEEEEYSDDNENECDSDNKSESEEELPQMEKSDFHIKLFMLV